jgi:hypothetical protein
MAYRGYDGKCYASAEKLNAAIFGSVPPQVSHAADGSTMLTWFATTNGVNWSMNTYRTPAAGGGSAQTWSESAGSYWGLVPECNPAEGFTDGITVGWGIAAAIILAASLRLLKRV